MLLEKSRYTQLEILGLVRRGDSAAIHKVKANQFCSLNCSFRVPWHNRIGFNALNEGRKALERCVQVRFSGCAIAVYPLHFVNRVIDGTHGGLG
jgi:hypothetical protein